MEMAEERSIERPYTDDAEIVHSIDLSGAHGELLFVGREKVVSESLLILAYHQLKEYIQTNYVLEDDKEGTLESYENEESFGAYWEPLSDDMNKKINHINVNAQKGITEADLENAFHFTKLRMKHSGLLEE